MAEYQNLLNSEQAAAYLNLSGGRRAMEYLRNKDKGPKFIRLNSRAIRYRLDDLQAYVAEKEITPKEASE